MFINTVHCYRPLFCLVPIHNTQSTSEITSGKYSPVTNSTSGHKLTFKEPFRTQQQQQQQLIMIHVIMCQEGYSKSQGGDSPHQSTGGTVAEKK